MSDPADDSAYDDGSDGRDWQFDPSPLEPFEAERQFQRLMDRIKLARGVSRTLFTFGDSEIPYLLVFPPGDDGQAEVRPGRVKVSRPTILTPSSEPEFFGLFEEMADEAGVDLSDFVQFALRRTAAFERLKVENESQLPSKPGGGVAEVVDRLNAKLDNEDDEDTSILIAPRGLGALAVLKLTGDRIQKSSEANVNDLRLRGFLPD